MTEDFEHPALETTWDVDLGGGTLIRWWDNANRAFIRHPVGPAVRPGTIGFEQGYCEATLVFDEKHHVLVSRDPVTIEPSLHCTICDWHVFIREGKVM